MRIRSWHLCTALLLSAAVAQADVSRVQITPIKIGDSVSRILAGNGRATTGTLVYDNTANFSGYTTNQQTNEVADDIHMTAAGVLTDFTFSYNGPANGTVVIRFYANNSADDPPSTLVAGPYTISGLPSGGNIVTVAVNDTPVLPQDVWLSQQFTTGGTSRGPLMFDPPVVGASHDYFYRISGGTSQGYLWFGGAPVANFGNAVWVTAATPANPATWGKIKSLWR